MSDEAVQHTVIVLHHVPKLLLVKWLRHSKCVASSESHPQSCMAPSRFISSSKSWTAYELETQRNIRRCLFVMRVLKGWLAKLKQHRDSQSQCCDGLPTCRTVLQLLIQKVFPP